MRRALEAVLVILLTAGAAAQLRPIFDPDDFVDPRGGGTFFVSRLVVGGAWNLIDDYRPVDQDAVFVHLTNSLYWSHFQLSYKHSEVRGSDASAPERVQSCRCNEPIFFPTPRTGDETPAAPLPGPKDSLQFAWYRAAAPLMLRYRLTWSRQPIETEVRSATNGALLTRLSGREQSFGLEAETHFRIRGRDLYGSLLFARTARSGTSDDRSQNELVYMARFPAIPVRSLLVRANLTIGGVSGRGAAGVNLLNPALEAFWHDDKTEANLHLVYSPQAIRSGADGWKTHHQIALFADRALFAKLFTRN